MYSAQRQAGSVITYLIVGVVLVAVGIGAVVAVQNRSSSDLATRPESSEVAQQDTDERLVHEEEEQAPAPESESSRTERAESDSSVAEESPDTAAQSANTDAGAEAVAPQAEASMPTGGVAVEGQGELPSTGPMQTVLGNVIGLVAIVGAGYGYYHFGQRR